MIEYCAEDSASLLALIKAMMCVKAFREAHFRITIVYILSRTSLHAYGAGGAPAIMFLPNQLNATMDYIIGLCKSVVNCKSKADSDNT